MIMFLVLIIQVHILLRVNRQSAALEYERVLKFLRLSEVILFFMSVIRTLEMLTLNDKIAPIID